MAAAVAAYLRPRQAFKVKSITSLFLLQQHCLMREYPIEFLLSVLKGTNAAV